MDYTAYCGLELGDFCGYTLSEVCAGLPGTGGGDALFQFLYQGYGFGYGGI